MSRVRSLFLTCAACSVVLWDPARAQTTEVLDVDIAPQPVARALSEFAVRTGLQVIYVAQIAATQISSGAPRGLSTRDALARLLDGTGLDFEYLNDRTVRIFAAARAERRPGTRAAAVPAAGVPSGAPTAPLVAFEEIVVTAKRRQQPLDDVPISAAVWTQQAMEASGVKGIDEIGGLTPGVEFDFVSRFGDYFTNLVIRGVTDMNGTAVSVFLDDTPLPPGRGETFLRSYPVTFDLDRVEVLRGPQGGLLGQDALGGAVRFVTNAPSLTSYSGQVRTEVATTARGDPSYEAGGAAGGPLIDRALGVRMSGWYRTDGGYVDRVDPFTGATVDADANSSTTRSFRAAVAWAPVASVRLTPSLSWQSIRVRDQSTFYTHLSDPDDGELLNGAQTRQPFEDEFTIGSLNVSADLGRVELVALTSYIDRHSTAALDYSPLDHYEPLNAIVELEQAVFSHEIRLSSTDPATTLGWIAGMWYSDSRIREGSVAEDDGAARLTATEQTQLAGFGQISIRLGRRLTATAGVRVGRSHFDSVTEVPPSERAQDSETSTTPRFGLTYESDRYGLLYATVARGYRSGGVYAPHLGCGDAPAPYASDSLWSYEVGSKSSLLEQRLDLDASVFHIRWDNERPGAATNCIAFTYRPVSAAVSNGFNVAARLYSGRVRSGLAVAYTDAHYTRTVRSGDDVVIAAGDAVGLPPQMPSPWTVTTSLERDFFVASGLSVTVRAEDVFHSENPGPLYTRHPASPYYSPERRADPSTNLVNLRVMLDWSNLETTLFVNNILDSQPELNRINACCDDPLFTASTFRPRTIGLSAAWRF